MVREIVEDSMYIIRHTNRATYEQSVAARAEVQSKLQELERVNKEILKAPEEGQVFRTFENVDAQKKALDEQVREPMPLLLNGAVCGADARGLLSHRSTASPSSSSCRPTPRSPNSDALPRRRPKRE